MEIPTTTNGYTYITSLVSMAQVTLQMMAKKHQKNQPVYQEFCEIVSTTKGYTKETGTKALLLIWKGKLCGVLPKDNELHTSNDC